MKLRKMLKTGLLTVCMVVMAAAQTGVQTVWAEKGGNESSYTYTVTLYSGKEGTFSDGSSEIKITGLQYGDVVSLGQYLPSVSLKDADKYYVRGVRESGKDNNTVSNPAFKVESDREYVVAYGIKGNMTTYTVNYQDQEGNTLAPSETYYGVVGDKAVVAFRYVDGYRPQAYNLTKTLSSNEAENVLTFTYQKITQNNGNNGAGGNNGNTGDSNTGNDADTGDNGSSTNNNSNVAGNVTNDSATTENTGTNSGNSTNTDNVQNQTDTTESPDSETPKDEINLDDDKTPLANKDLSKAKSRPAGIMYVLIAIAVAAIAALITLLVAMKKKDKKKREE